MNLPDSRAIPRPTPFLDAQPEAGLVGVMLACHVAGSRPIRNLASAFAGWERYVASTSTCRMTLLSRNPPIAASHLSPADWATAPHLTLPSLSPCPHCAVTPDRVWLQNEHAIAFAERPVVDGHMIVVPRNHVGTIYELTMPEQVALWALVAELRGCLLAVQTLGSFVIGFDDGVHASVHLVPRRKGDGLGQATASVVTDLTL